MRNLLPLKIAENYEQKKYKDSFSAYTMFVDISGFTVMTETLMKQGKHGAEELQEILRYIFNNCAEYIYKYNGFITAYAGDAFTAVFPVDNSSVNNILKAGCLINSFIAKKGSYSSDFGSFKFGVKIGLAKGEVIAGIITEEENSIFYFKGEGIDNCAYAEHQADKGDIILTEEVYKDPDFNYSEFCQQKENNYYLLKNFKPEDTKASYSAKRKISKEILEAFNGNEELAFPEGEFREVISVFIAFKEEENVEKLVKNFFQERRIYKCSHPKLFFGDKGGNLLCFFGAPVTFENNVERANRLILALKQAFPSIRAGLAKGIVFSGFYGADIREEFSCLGNTINQSARFMMKAKWGEILTDKGCVKKERFTFTHKGDFNYKGRKEKIPTYELTGTVSKRKREIKQKIIGRDKEIKAILDFLKPLKEDKFCGYYAINGQIGIGKTELAAAVKEQFTSNFDCHWLLAPTDELLPKSYHPFIHLLKTYFKFNERKSNSDNLSNFEQLFATLVNSNIEKEIISELKRTKSFLAALLGLYWEDSLYSRISGKARQDNTEIALENFLKVLSIEKPLVIDIDDAQWLDNSSKDFIFNKSTGFQKFAIAFIATLRVGDNGKTITLDFPEEIAQKSLTLQPLNLEDVKEVILNRLNITKEKIIEENLEKTAKLLFEKSNGVPFYLEQILLFSKENNQINEDLSFKNFDLTLNSDLHNLIIARIDRMEKELAEIIKTASVLGKEFALDLLKRILQKEAIKLDNFSEKIDFVHKEEIFSLVSKLKTNFKHAILRYSAYDMQLAKRVRKLHLLAAETTETLYKDKLENYYEELAFHYEKATEIIKALNYYEKAAIQEKEAFRIPRAKYLFEKWFELAQQYLEVKDFDFINLDVTDENRWLVDKMCENVFSYKGIISGVERKVDAAFKLLDNFKLFIPKLKDSAFEGRLIFEIGDICQQKRDFVKAEECLISAKNIFKVINHKYLATTFYSLGINNFKQGKLKDAEKYFKQGIETAKKHDFKTSLASSLSALGTINDYQGNLDTALDYYQQSLEIAEELHDLMRKQIYIGNIAIIYTLKKEYKRALDYYLKKLDACKRIGNKQSLAIVYENIASNYISLKDYEKAKATFLQAKKIALSIQDVVNYSHILLLEAFCYRHEQNYQEAEAIYFEVAKIIESKQISNQKPILFCGLAEVYFQKIQYNKSLTYAKQANEIAIKMNFKEYIDESEQILDKLKEKGYS